MEKLEAFVEREIFKSKNNDFGIYRVRLLEGAHKELTVKGPLFNIELSSSYRFFGQFEDDSRYGIQFRVSHYEEILPSDREFVLRYLSGPSFPGIGIKSAEAIVEAYGEDVLDKIRQGEISSMSVPGISDQKTAEIVETIRNENPLEKAQRYLMAHHLSTKQIIKISREYGDQTLQVLEENPYQMLYDISGIGFKTADKIASDMNFSKDHPERIKAYLLDKYKSIAFRRGDSFLYMDEFLEHLPLELYPHTQWAISELVEQGELIYDNKLRLYHYTQYESETAVADFVRSFTYVGSEFTFDFFDEYLKEVEEEMSLTFDPSQKEAIASFFEEDMLIMTGGPGTGKSTLLAAMVRMMQKVNPWLHISLCAPTGRAAKRLKELTNVEASTIHSILKWDPDSNEFGQNEENPLETDILIVDEFSMVDVWLLAKIFEASSSVKKFLFVGDKDQLPSVGPGFVLSDMIESKALPVVYLEHNYRQEKGSEVVDLALKVRDGEFSGAQYEEEVSFYDSREHEPLETVMRVTENFIQRGYDLSEIQVLAPQYRGRYGIDNLNHFLQKSFNPPSKEKEERVFASHIFREGDKILQLKNQPDDFVFNGDVGILEEVYDDLLRVNFDGNMVEYANEDLINITHAYAMSVHKAQGSEYPVVILLAKKEYAWMLSRRLYYTGMTRSSKYLVLIGDYEAFEKAAHQQYESLRYTALSERLKK